MMGLISPAIRGIFKIRNYVITNFINDPIQSQINVLDELISEGAQTEFGKKYNFQNIKTADDFRKIVPITSYEQLFPYIERIMHGEQNILWPSPINWFAKSSGTSGAKSKYIPVSREALDENHFKAGKDVLGMYIKERPESNLFEGKCLTIGGSNTINQLNPDSYYGDLSAVMLQNMSFVGQLMRAPELSIALMEKWDEKIKSIIEHTQNENITFMAGVPTWTLLLLKEMLHKNGANDLRDIWPNMELYLHGGINFEPYKQQFENIIPHANMNYMETYNASEGFFAAQNNLKENSLLLYLNHGIFFEFMPLSELEETHPQTLLLDEVKTNTSYALVISTNAGLWRYIVGDTIQFTNLNPFKIKIVGRVTQYINAFGEELMVHNADAAITQAANDCKVNVNDYSASPIFYPDNNVGAHEWIIAFEDEPKDLNAFSEKLDYYLKESNSDYEAKRYKNIALMPPIIHAVPKDFFNQWLKSIGKQGGQNKVPRLSNKRKIMEQLLAFKNIYAENAPQITNQN